MQKTILKITFIICANLLAFLCIGLILDALFKTEGRITLVSVVLSLPVLGLIMYLKVTKILQDLHTLSPTHDQQRNNNNN